MTCAIIGIGRTEYTRRSGRTTRAMAISACRDALADANLTPADVDGMCTFQANDSIHPMEVSWGLGQYELKWSNSMLGGGNLVADQIATAAAAIEAGLCRAVLVYRSLNGRSGYRFGTIEGPMQVPGHDQYDAQAGFIVPPFWFAMWARRHMHVYGTTNEDFGAIACSQRAHAVNNEHAVRRDPMTLDQYLDGRWIAEPFRVYDCTSEVDGAVAILIAGEDVVRDSGRTPAWLVGSSNTQSGAGWSQAKDTTKKYASIAGPRIWESTGLKPSDMDLACIYDCFTYTVLASMEGFGFCEPGTVGEFYREGRATYGGDVVVNPHGGLLSEGYIHGLNHYYEAALQLRGEAGVRQVDNAQLALVSAGGGGHGGANIFSKEKP